MSSDCSKTARKPDKFAYVLSYMADASAMRIRSESGYEPRVFLTREGAEKEREQLRRAAQNVTWFIDEWPLDFVAVDDP